MPALLPPSFPFATDFGNAKASDLGVIRTHLSLGFGSKEKQAGA
jgi:hypothetical protein